MARRALGGGYKAIEIGVGQDHLDALDAARERHGWSRAEWFRRASAALLRADRAALLRAQAAVSEGDDDEGEPEDVDLEDAVEDLDDPDRPGGTGTTGPIIARGASAMAKGRWAGWYPQDLTDAEIVADLRRCTPGGTVYLRRPKSHPDALVHAYVDTAAEVASSAAFGTRPAPFYRVIGPDDPA